MDEFYIGSIVIFAGNYAPNGWAFCDGSLISIAENSALFSILGTTYGGDGQQTFALPDLRGAMVLGQGTSKSGNTYVLGQTGGSEFITLAHAQMPTHTHALHVPVTEAGASVDTPNGAILASQSSSFYAALSTADNTYGGTACTTIGGNQATDIRSPYLAVNYIISLYGIYPPRS
jgi:microcystin-dependent protein